MVVPSDVIVVDNFLDNFGEFRESCDQFEFYGETSPADGVFYPGVSVDFPVEIYYDVVGKTEGILGGKITPKVMFLRLSVEGVEAPHQAHNDSIMSSYAMMVYLNRAGSCEGGTSFVSHKEIGMQNGPANEVEQARWELDNSDPTCWDVINMCEMKENRAVIFRSEKMHRAEPVGGFGSGPKDGRLVLCFFFDLQ